MGNHTLYFDSCDHLIRFLQEVDFLLKAGKVPKGKVSDVFLKTADTGSWRSASRVRVVERDGGYTAYEKPPEGGKVLDLEGLLADFQHKLGIGGS
ncbi:MAG: hypothetical protein Q9N34_07855 [Aquificota bacterium]|nr:hypothetical protein [Aquificota bacterium]